MPGAGTVACPYCNAFVPVPAGTAAGRRLACPRCGEAFAFLPRDGVTDAPGPGDASTPSNAAFMGGPTLPEAPDRDTLQAKVRLLVRVLLLMAGVLVIVGGAYVNSQVANGLPLDVATFAGVAVPLVTLLVAVGAVAFLWIWFFRVPRSNGATSLFVLANMVSLALLTLGGALATQNYRRHIDAGLPARPKRSPIPEEITSSGPTAVAPIHLAALAYLPPKIDLLAGVHVAELMEDPAGQKLINEPLKFGNAEVRLADLPGKLGLGAKDLDHFVVGMRLDEPLSFVFVIRTRQPEDAAKVRKVLDAHTLPGSPADRTLYEAKSLVGNVPALLWCADDQTLLIALARESLEKAVLPEKQKPNPIDADVQDVLRTRVGPLAQLWVVGHSADWTKTAAALLLARLPAEWQERLAAARAFCIWAAVEGKAVTLNAAARCDDEQATGRLEKWLAERTAGKNAPRLSREGNWLSLQKSTDADSFRTLFAPEQPQ